MEFWRKRAERDGKVAQGWAELARAYLARHHQSGSLDDARRAEESARRAMALGGGAGVQVILGRALLSQHRFPEALAVAERAARGDGLANALLCDVLIELGRLDRAAPRSPPTRGPTRSTGSPWRPGCSRPREIPRR